MKDNTYIIPAIGFYVVVPMFKCYRIEEINIQMKENVCFYIPFSQVDGLTLEELLNIEQFQNGFSVSAINRIECFEPDTNVLIRNEVDKLFFPCIEKIQDSEKNKRIDKIVEENYELMYSDANDEKRKIYNCFFEKYRDGSYSETKKRIDKILEKNRKNI